jgi:hypothetical protein
MRIDRKIKRLFKGGLVVRILKENGGVLARSPVIKLKNSPLGSSTEVSFSFVAKSGSSQLKFRSNKRYEASADDFVVNPVSF